MEKHIISDFRFNLAAKKVLSALKLTADEEPELADAFKITRIPTLVVFKNGAVVSTSVGVRPKSAVIDMLHV